MASADNSPYNANAITCLLIIKLYANDIIVRIHIKIAFSSKVTMRQDTKIGTVVVMLNAYRFYHVHSLWCTERSKKLNYGICYN